MKTSTKNNIGLDVMKKILQIFNNQSLKIQLTIWFLIIALIPLTWTTYVTYRFALKNLQKQAENHLNALVIRQVALQNLFLAEKERMASSMAKESLPPIAEEAMEQILKTYGKNSKEFFEVYDKFAPLLSEQAETLNLRNFILVDDDGTIVLSLAPKLLQTGFNLLHPENENQKVFSELFTKASTELKPQISPLFFLSENSPPGIFISAPIIGHANNLLGVLLFQISNTSLYQPIRNFKGLGKTGETLIAMNIDSQYIVYSHEKKGFPRVYRINPDSSFGKYITETLQGKSIIDYVEDYHGNETIIVGKKINPHANWAIITKVDHAEIIGAFTKLKYFSWILLAITTVFVIMIASYVARKIAKPILMLTEKTKLMTAGDLNQRIHIPYKNELGRLGTSFNEMAAQLDHIIHHLDALVAKRTEEVENKNTQLNHTIEELREAQNRLITQEKLASLGALTAGIAHEIKNPLNFVNNFAELSSQIQKDLADQIESMGSILPQEKKDELLEMLATLKLNIEKIYKHGKRADSIVHNMLQHSRATPGDKDLIDLNNLLDEYVGLAYHGMRAKDTSFNVKIEKNYDHSLSKMFVSPQEISRVFLNLLNNALYAINLRQKNSKQPYESILRITTEERTNEVLIKIWDNGVGIPEDIFPKLFTPFFTTKPTGEGTGLGLSLSYNIIVQGHNGKLTVKSEEGNYTEFTIQLPKEKQD
jgi:signal transduction histidine kinase